MNESHYSSQTCDFVSGDSQVANGGGLKILVYLPKIRVR